ncbi:MAG: cytochrome-c oxidase, cbb3-type subunit II [Alphaproteobacteria bacterium]
MSILSHSKIERSIGLLAILTVLTISIGGLVEIVPLFTIEKTLERVEGVRPYSPLELTGRNIYIREGCYTCHSQQIRPFRDEVERYGHYSLAAESRYDHPFQWGSKRTGPDLARVGGKYSNQWHAAHFLNPREVVPESIMPSYSFLAGKSLRDWEIADHLKANRTVGVPYTDEQIAQARNDLLMQANPDADTDDLLARYPNAATGDFDGNPDQVTEMDALIAYMQILGRMVDFSTVTPEQLRQ